MQGLSRGAEAAFTNERYSDPNANQGQFCWAFTTTTFGQFQTKEQAEVLLVLITQHVHHGYNVRCLQKCGVTHRHRPPVRAWLQIFEAGMDLRTRHAGYLQIASRASRVRLMSRICAARVCMGCMERSNSSQRAISVYMPCASKNIQQGVKSLFKHELQCAKELPFWQA